jgi:hypothetical protein
MPVNVQNGTMMYPCFTPRVKRLPPIAGPAARPIAETLVASPLRVPRTRKLPALLVSMMVDVGKANVPPRPRMTIKTTIATSLAVVVGSRDMNGVTKKTNGNIKKAIRRQRRTPRYRARGGKSRNCESVDDTEKKVKMTPMRRECNPKPPANLRGNETSGLSMGCGG